jgi:hypothetical protein
MKPKIISAIYLAIVTNSEGCDILKKLTNKSWHEYPLGTKRTMIIAAIWGTMILVLIARDILTSPKR